MHPECKKGCAYARDIGMAPAYQCSGACQYAQASLAALKNSKAMREAKERNAYNERMAELDEEGKL